MDVRTRELLGVPIAVTDYAGAMDAMDGMIARRERGYVGALAVHALMVAGEDPEMGAAVRGASMNVPDGKPLVWALNLLGERLTDRVYGPELTDRYCARSARARASRVALRRRDRGGARPARDGARAPTPGDRGRGWDSPPHRPLTAQEESDGRRAHQRRSAGRRLGRHRGSQTGELDGAHAPAARGPGARRSRRGVRLPRGPQAPGAGLDAAARPRVAVPPRAGAAPAAPCVTCATTPRSLRASRASTCASGAGRSRPAGRAQPRGQRSAPA